MKALKHGVFNWKSAFKGAFPLLLKAYSSSHGLGSSILKREV